MTARERWPEIERLIIEKNERDVLRVISLCDEIGYGFVIDVASREWARKAWGPDSMARWLETLAKDLRAKSKARRKPLSKRERDYPTKESRKHSEQGRRDG